MLSEAVQLYRFARDTGAAYPEGRQLHARASLNRTVINTLQKLDESELVEEVVIEGKAHGTAELDQFVGTEADIHIHLPHRSEHGLFAWNLDDVLERDKYLTSLPARFYLADSDWMSGEDNEPDLITNYRRATKLVTLLSIIADHKEDSATGISLIFWTTEKIKLPLTYRKDDISTLLDLERLENEIADENRRSESASLLKNSLIEFLRPWAEAERFSHLLKYFHDFVDRYNENYQLYLSKFSFQELIEEVEEKKLEYIGKLNSILGDIQNKLLAIPLALILVGSQLKDTGTVEIGNCVILSGAFIFSILMSILLVNQESTLIHLKQEIDNLQARFRRKDTQISYKFTKQFNALNRRYKMQYTWLALITLLVWVPFGISLFLFTEYSF